MKNAVHSRERDKGVSSEKGGIGDFQKQLTLMELYTEFNYIGRKTKVETKHARRPCAKGEQLNERPKESEHASKQISQQLLNADLVALAIVERAGGLKM